MIIEKKKKWYVIFWNEKKGFYSFGAFAEAELTFPKTDPRSDFGLSWCFNERVSSNGLWRLIATAGELATAACCPVY